METPGTTIAIIAILSYLLGSIPFGLLLTRMAGLGDIRNVGSGNVGATNVLRTGHKGIAAATLILDAAKGAAPVLALAVWPVGHADLGLMAGLAAILGHNFPVWLKFQGGKGVATSIGALLAIAWPVGLAFCIIWLVMLALFRFSSLAAIIAFAVTPVFAYALADKKVTALVVLLAVLGIVRHHANLRRLIGGTESKVGGG
ncbi:MAG: glycerol-3-phosphate 1-O-acyltransferase PlsY [Rhodospirillaceae bacterium]|nr:glycerol-3-phosphate 1-O-acyltransferase PlsY [Rhodospirillaceae bacterium]MBT3885053.1 glycerol-3-phosphate 1-O-acyltransferase PlsY [Rhodospirillaceae bacterium]MBT4116244.1 glycerol-3-phosphate 1-O-acyltransferase PlsY [Rhodospirillaceae bacterium]MBT4673908.1 glycerol-3-phosphate 1-O-acyltransferase PlsY [Rhodospirillaceae bacterium]MBT4718787.1 glycerol-3-phosphate 1-O-acyltransferase PlsY [Rhodospirillaceae bacterium]